MIIEKDKFILFLLSLGLTKSCPGTYGLPNLPKECCAYRLCECCWREALKALYNTCDGLSTKTAAFETKECGTCIFKVYGKGKCSLRDEFKEACLGDNFAYWVSAMEVNKDELQTKRVMPGNNK